MTNIKVGDKVRYKNGYNFCGQLEPGQVGIITQIGSDRFYVNNCWHTFEKADQLEIVSVSKIDAKDEKRAPARFVVLWDEAGVDPSRPFPFRFFPTQAEALAFAKELLNNAKNSNVQVVEIKRRWTVEKKFHFLTKIQKV